MSLVFNKSISQDGKTLYFTDATTEYGGDLDVRANLALVMRATYKKSDGDVDVVPVNYDPLDVATFSIDVTDTDGVYEFEIVALIEYNGQGLTTGDLVYDINDAQIKRYDGSQLNVLDFDTLLTYSPTLFTDDALITSRLTILRDNLELRQLEKLEDYEEHVCEYNDYKRAKQDFDYVRSLRSGAIIDFCRDRKTQAQLKIETAIEFGDKAMATVL